MKRKLIVVLMCATTLLTFSACTADEINKTIEDAAKQAGVEVDVNITQDQVDKASEAVGNATDTVKDIVSDEEVKKSVTDLLDAVKNAGKNE